MRALCASGAGAEPESRFSTTVVQSTGGNPSAAPKLMISMGWFYPNGCAPNTAPVCRIGEQLIGTLGIGLGAQNLRPVTGVVPTGFRTRVGTTGTAGPKVSRAGGKHRCTPPPVGLATSQTLPPPSAYSSERAQTQMTTRVARTRRPRCTGQQVTMTWRSRSRSSTVGRTWRRQAARSALRSTTPSGTRAGTSHALGRPWRHRRQALADGRARDAQPLGGSPGPRSDPATVSQTF